MSFMEKEKLRPESKYARKKRELAKGIREPFEFKEKRLEEPIQPARIAKPAESRSAVRRIGKVVFVKSSRTYARLEDADGHEYYLPMRRLDFGTVRRIAIGVTIEFTPVSDHHGKIPRTDDIEILNTESSA